jgi:hypothetical protein
MLYSKAAESLSDWIRRYQFRPKATDKLQENHKLVQLYISEGQAQTKGNTSILIGIGGNLPNPTVWSL